MVAPPLTYFCQAQQDLGSQKPSSQAGQHLLVTNLPSTEFPLECVSQDSAASQNYDLKIKLSVEFAEEGECWDGLWGEMWVPFIYSFLLCDLLEARVYLYCPGNHWAFQKNHLKLDVTEFLKQPLLENTLAVN